MNEKPGIFTIYLQLMKLRVVILLQITAICAILAHDLMVRSDAISGDRSWFDTLEACLVTLVGGTLAAGGSNAINMFYDRDIDPGMSRTRARPIPNGWISPNHALVFGILIAIIGFVLCIHLHNMVEEKNSSKYCNRWCSRLYSAVDWLDCSLDGYNTSQYESI
jgi:heme O synthase-like polyprenyltransferase